MRKKLQVFIIRHGESIWNHDSKFTGWTNIPLTEKGKKEAKQIAKTLQSLNMIPDIFFSSVLDRSINTANIIRNTLNVESPIYTSWRLNEKHYGTLEGMPREYIRKEYGKKFTQMLRNNFYMKPPVIKKNDRITTEYKIFKNCYFNTIKNGESKENVLDRLLPFFQNDILYSLNENKKPIVITHKHCLRVLLKHYLDLSDEDFEYYNTPDKSILIMDFDKKNMEYISHNFIKY